MNQRGFTLVEIMVAVGIATVLAMMAIPNYLVWNANQKLKADVSGLKGDLQLARSVALKTGQSVVVEFGKPQANRYQIFLDNGVGVGGTPNNGIMDGGEAVINHTGRQVPAPDAGTKLANSRLLESGISFSAVESVGFGSLGMRSRPVATTTVSLTLKNDHNATRTLLVLPLGEVR